MELQRGVLASIAGARVGDKWFECMRTREFVVGDRKDQRVSYAVGQGMGILSSFPVMALTHHVIVQRVAKKSGAKLPFRDYAILGDDIVI